MEDKPRDEQGEGYTKVDRRAGRDDAGPAEHAGDPPEPEEVPQSDEPVEAAQSEQTPTQDAPEPPEPEEAAQSEEPVEAAPPEEAPPEQPPLQAEDEGPDLAEIGVYGVLRFCANLLMQQAWISLGIQAPGGEIKESIPEAKVAIDTLAEIVERLQPDLDGDEKRELESVLANLRVNYVQRA